MRDAMQLHFGLIKRPWGVYYIKNKITGKQASLKTRDKVEAQRLLQAQNDTHSQPQFNLALARVYINGADPKLGTRTWQEVMEHILESKTDETRRRWEVAVKDKNFDCIRDLAVAETRPEHFDRALADGKVSTNVYLRRIHNHALGMEWLLRSVIARLQWPRPGLGPSIKRSVPLPGPSMKPSSRGSKTLSGEIFTNCCGTPGLHKRTQHACWRRMLASLASADWRSGRAA
jgi:hypothetical protein